MKRFMLGLLSTLGLLFLGYGSVLAQSMPSIGTNMASSTISQPYQQSQCVEPDGSIVYVQRHFYFGDTYTTRDIVPKWGNGYDTLLLNSSRVLVYNSSLFNFTSPITWRSNGIPNNAPVSSMVSAQGTFTVNSTNPGQLVYNIHRTALENAGSSSYTLSYLGRTNLINYTATLTNKTFHNQAGRVVNGYECVNYTVHYCGDGVVDTQQSIAAIAGGMPNSIANEQCDGTAGVPAGYTCTSTCTLQAVAVRPTCTLSVSSGTIMIGSSVQATWNISGNYTNTPQITYTPTTRSITGLPYIVPNAQGQRTIIPQHIGNYTLSMTVSNSAGSSTCTAQLAVAQPLQCSLVLDPNPANVGDPVAVQWNVTGGNFYGTYIYVTPAMQGARPHRINANQYSGTTYARPSQTGEYLFTLMVNNTQSSAICTGILDIVDDILSPTCSLTTTTPNINLGQTALLNASYTNASLATMTPNIFGLNFTYPNRSNPAIVVTPTATTTYTLDVLGTNGSGINCQTTINVVAPGSLTLTKELVNNVLYRSGDLVTFRIDFTNNSSQTVSNIVLSDTLPLSLEYVSSSIYGITPPYNFGTGIESIYEYIQYSGFSLAPGQQGYMLIVGRFKGYEYLQHMINNVFLRGEGTSLLHAAAGFAAYVPTANATITKTSDQTSYYPGQNARFTLAVTNNGPDTISNIVITDDRPNTACITPDSQWTSNVPLVMTNTTDPYTWTYNGNLGVGQTIYIYITGHISNDVACAGTYINNAAVSYVVNGVTQTGETQLSFIVTATPTPAMTIEKRLLQYGNNPGDPVVFELLYQNNGTATINSYDIVDYWPGTLQFVSAVPMPTTQTPTTGGLLLHWIFTTPLAPNGTGKIIINGTIK